MTDIRDALLLLWAAGEPAPYALFDGQTNLDGLTPLVEGGSGKRVVATGDEITPEVAARIKAQVYRPKGEPIEVDVLVRDEKGEPVIDENGGAVTIKMTITPEPPPFLLSVVDRPIAREDVMICDQCGQERDELFTIGDGRYCKVQRGAPNDVDENGKPRNVTCFDRRLEQMA